MSAATLITGGTGFVGKALLREWSQSIGRTVRPVILSRDPRRFAREQPELSSIADFTTGDVLSIDSLPSTHRFQNVLHAAADSTHGDRLSPLERYDQIVTGTRNMLDFAVKCGAKRFLYISSGGVYGRQPADLDRIPENYHGMPNPLSSANAYGVAKRAAEHLCTLYAERHGLEVVIARCFAFVGQDLPLDVHFAIGNFIRDALWRDEILVQGDGTAVRSYMDQRDLVHWLLALLEHGKSGEAYNVGSDEAISIADLAHLVRDVVSPGKPVRILGKSVGNSERSRYVPDVSKATQKLGLRFTFSHREAVREAALIRNSLQADPF